MFRPQHLLAPIALVATLSACAHTATVGAFAVDVPKGWEHEAEDADSLGVGTRHAEWTFMFMAFTDAEIEGDKSLDAVGREAAAELTKDDDDAEGSEGDDVSMEFDDPKEWSSAGGLRGVVMDGRMGDAELSVQLKLMIVVSGSDYLLAFGFRSPDAGPKHDAAMQAMLDSIRLAAP